MGLDMYLTKKYYVQNWNHYPAEDRWDVKMKHGGKAFKVDGEITYIETQVAYWRKANAIHQWFVDNCQNGVDECQKTPVTVEQLQALLDVVEKVLADHKAAPDALPTQVGFFFGGTDYDDWYWEDLANTKKMLKKIVNSKEPDGVWADYYYQSSW